MRRARTNISWRFFSRLTGAAVVLLVTVSATALAQQGSLVELRSADTLRGHVEGGEEVRELIGNVHFVQLSADGDSVLVWTDRALRYMTRDMIELIGHVRMVRGEATLLSTFCTYYAREKRAEMPKGVTLEREGATLTADRGTYWVDEKKAFAQGHVVLVDSVSRTTSDAMTYFETADRAVAVGHVQVLSLRENVIILGDSLVHYRKTGRSIVPAHPTLVQIDSSSSGDTLVVVSERMEAFQDTSDRFVAVGDVKIVRGDLSSRCGRALLNRTSNVLTFQSNPIVWQAGNQLTGDSIAAFLDGNELRRLHVIGRAMAVSRSDSAYPQRFNQLTGREIFLLFFHRTLREIEVVRNATSLYYLYEELKPNGVNRSSGDRIRIDFGDGQLDRITVVGGVEGTYVPESMLLGRESEYNLDGFRWVKERPTRTLLTIDMRTYD